MNKLAQNKYLSFSLQNKNNINMSFAIQFLNKDDYNNWLYGIQAIFKTRGKQFDIKRTLSFKVEKKKKKKKC